MIYRIVSYDRSLETMKGSLVVPPSVLAKVKKIAGFQPQHDGLGEYPLNEAQTRLVAKSWVLGRNPTTFIITSSRMIRLKIAVSSKKPA